MSQIKTIIFDADGMVLKNGEFFTQKYAREHKVSTDQIETFFKYQWPEIIVGKTDLKEQLEYYLPTWNWKQSVDMFLQYWFESEHNLDHELIGLISKLKAKGLECLLATNQERYRLNYIKNEMKLDSVFDRIYASGEIGERKPHLDFYEKMWKDLGESDKKSIVFWDDQRKNVFAARKFGFNAYLYTSNQHFVTTLKKLGVRL